MSTDSKRQVRYCIRCDQSGPAGMRRLIGSRLAEGDGVTDDDKEMKSWVHHHCLGEHRAKVLAEGLAAIARYEQQEGLAKQTARVDLETEVACRGLLQQLADDLAASGHTAKK